MTSNDPIHAPLHCLMAFSRSVHVRRMVERIALEPKQTFWIMVMNQMMQSASLEWSKVFGSWEEKTHWTKFFPEQQHGEIRAGLLVFIGMGAEDWAVYRETIIGYRNQLVAHHDIDAEIKKNPQFDFALSAACYMFDRLREKADPDWLGGIPISLDRWAKSAARHMAPIVNKAFAASAKLGSNVPDL